MEKLLAVSCILRLTKSKTEVNVVLYFGVWPQLSADILFAKIKP